MLVREGAIVEHLSPYDIKPQRKSHREVRSCIRCDKEFCVFPCDKRQTCSLKCTNRLLHYVIHRCEHCGKEREIQRKMAEKRRYCGRECFAQARLATRIEKKCLQCETVFYVIPHRQEAKYCGISCQNEAYSGEGNPYYGRKHSTETREQLSSSLKNAWVEGKFDDVIFTNVKWYDYVDVQGRKHHVQGTWELSFVTWLDEKGFEFESHPAPLTYAAADGSEHLYFPDFWVKDWNGEDAYVDPKNEFVFALSNEKFEMIRKSNPEENIVILREYELKQLGVL